MNDMISRVMAVLLAFVLLILCPMTISRMTEDMASRRQVLNEVTVFIDRVTDKGFVSNADVEDLLLGINAHGGAFDALLVRYTCLAVKDNVNGDVRTVYAATDDDLNHLAPGETVRLYPGDAIQVRVNAVSRSKGQVLLQGLLRVYEKPFAFTLAGTVR